SEFTLSKDQPVTQQLRYDVLQFAQMRIDPVLTEASRRENLALPNEGNPQSRALAKQLFEQSGSDPVRYIAAIEQWINRTEFRYTLSPPRLNTNRIDEFLFETKAGFCEHYSSSFTFMLRAAGIPARVVAGYQGGEPSRNGNVWEVRQMDAHAWTEVWLEGQGWVRVDPTAFVAPERVEQGMNTMTEQQGAAMFGNGASAQISYQQYQMLQTLRRLSDQASYYWQKDVVGYDQDKQADSLFKWFNISSIMQQIIWLATSAVSVMVVLVFVIWYRRRKRWHPADLPLAQLSKRVAKHDKLLARNDNEGQLAWLERLASAIDSRKDNNAHSATSQLTDSSDPIVIQTKLIEIRQNYRQLRYGRLSTFDASHSEYQKLLKQLKKDVHELL
ncbi:transglutaminase-like domain-containing protein, partial [Marinobacter sp. 1Y8]